jgi:hypothetical protein
VEIEGSNPSRVAIAPRSDRLSLLSASAASRRPVLGALALALVLSNPAAAQPEDSTSGGRQRRGPPEIRDDHLLAQERLTLPPTSPDTLPAGVWSVTVSTLWSNSFSWTQDVPGEKPDDRRFLIDGETVTLATDIRYGLGAHLDLGLRLPILHRGGGSLDSLIDTWHRWLHLPDGARPSFRRDAFRVQGVTTQGSPFGWEAAEGSGLGNLELHGRWRGRDGGREGLSVTLVGRVVVPTATAPFDRSGLGAGGQIVSALPLARTLDLYLGAGLTVQDPGPVRRLRYARTRAHGFAALEWRPWRRVSLVAETNAASRLVENIDSYPGVHWMIDVSGRLDLGETTRLDLGLTEGLLDQLSTTDLAFYFALGWRR